MTALDDGFDQPTPVTDIQMAFAADLDGLIPAYHDVPESFRSDGNEESQVWRDLQAAWFFRGTQRMAVVARDDVDSHVAWRHLSVIQRSWEPRHEHKEAAVAWLMSRWFKAVKS